MTRWQTGSALRALRIAAIAMAIGLPSAGCASQQPTASASVAESSELASIAASASAAPSETDAEPSWETVEIGGDGDARIDMPGEPEVTELETPIGEGQVAETTQFVVLLQDREEGYFVSTNVYPQSVIIQDATAFVQVTLDGYLETSGATVEDSELVDVVGADAALRFFAVASDGALVNGMYVVVNQTLYNLVASGQVDSEEQDMFFGSFEVRD